MIKFSRQWIRQLIFSYIIYIYISSQDACLTARSFPLKSRTFPFDSNAQNKQIIHTFYQIHINRLIPNIQKTTSTFVSIFRFTAQIKRAKIQSQKWFSNILNPLHVWEVERTRWYKRNCTNISSSFEWAH